MAICSEDADIFHSIQTKPPFSVWSKAFFTIFITASISQLRSQTKSVDSSPERIISFSSCPARKRKLLNIFPAAKTHVSNVMMRENYTGCFMKWILWFLSWTHILRRKGKRRSSWEIRYRIFLQYDQESHNASANSNVESCQCDSKLHENNKKHWRRSSWEIRYRIFLIS